MTAVTSILKLLFNVVLAVLLLITLNHNVYGLHKMTNVFCESYNKSWLVFNECRLRAVNRNITKLYINQTTFHPVYSMDVNINFFKKANGYKPFPINTTFDVCRFMKKRNNPIGSMIYNLVFRNYTNMNHTCPYEGNLVVNGFYGFDADFELPFPDGEYLVVSTWYYSKLKIAVVKLYYLISSDKKLNSW